MPLKATITMVITDATGRVQVEVVVTDPGPLTLVRLEQKKQFVLEEYY